jgi:hypothetical protein
MRVVMLTFSRSDLLRRGGGALLVVSGAGLGALAGRAEAAGLPDADFAYLRLLVAAELLKTDFETRALASGKLAGSWSSLVRKMQADDRAHYAGLGAVMSGAGQTPSTAGDIDFSYPPGSFGSEDAVARLGWKLATLTMGAYLGAVENVQTPQLRLPLGQIAANEAQQLSAIAQRLGRPMIGGAFAASMPIDAVSAALDHYES